MRKSIFGDEVLYTLMRATPRPINRCACCAQIGNEKCLDEDILLLSGRFSEEGIS